VIGREPALSLHESTTRSTYRIAESNALVEAVLVGIGKALSASETILVKVSIRATSLPELRRRAGE
jgi:hypothetical protein